VDNDSSNAEESLVRAVVVAAGLYCMRAFSSSSFEDAFLQGSANRYLSGACVPELGRSGQHRAGDTVRCAFYDFFVGSLLPNEKMMFHGRAGFGRHADDTSVGVVAVRMRWRLRVDCIFVRVWFYFVNFLLCATIVGFCFSCVAICNTLANSSSN
jgi:hypothetical protein